MKRLVILAAVAAFSALALAGGTSAKTSRMSAEDQELCRLLELAHESSCVEYEAKLSGRNVVAKVLGASDEVTGSIANHPNPQSATQ